MDEHATQGQAADNQAKDKAAEPAVVLNVVMMIVRVVVVATSDQAVVVERSQQRLADQVLELSRRELCRIEGDQHSSGNGIGRRFTHTMGVGQALGNHRC
jgi:hypothetical protein